MREAIICNFKTNKKLKHKVSIFIFKTNKQLEYKVCKKLKTRTLISILHITSPSFCHHALHEGIGLYTCPHFASEDITEVCIVQLTGEKGFHQIEDAWKTKSAKKNF